MFSLSLTLTFSPFFLPFDFFLSASLDGFFFLNDGKRERGSLIISNGGGGVRLSRRISKETEIASLSALNGNNTVNAKIDSPLAERMPRNNRVRLFLIERIATRIAARRSITCNDKKKKEEKRRRGKRRKRRGVI